MSNSKHTKHALLVSVLAVVICVAMLAGSTFAWFTDSVTSGNNKIVAGNLDAEMYWADGTKDPADTTIVWTDASTGAIFNSNLWEPGYTEVRHVKISNKGNLALKYKVHIAANGKVSKLADVIDVYYIQGGQQIANRTDLTDINKIGTLKEVLAKPDIANGHIDGKNGTTVFSDVATIALKMQETAGNEYQDMSIGTDFSIQLVATQHTSEKDSFGSDYDDAAAIELKQAVTVKGIVGYENTEFSSMQEAYNTIMPLVKSLGGLGQESCTTKEFDAVYSNGGKIEWTIYGEQVLTDSYMLSFGRKASYYNNEREITEISVVAGNPSAALNLNQINGSFSLPYNWWGANAKNLGISFKGITFNGIKSIPSCWATVEESTPYIFDGCTFNGLLYGYHDYNIHLIIKNSTFNAPANTRYAMHLQSTSGIHGKVELLNNTFNGYTRGLNMERPNTEFVIVGNTITSTVQEPDRGAIQLTDGKSFVVTDNKINVNGGNAFWFHGAAKNQDVTYTINNNNISAPYLANDDTAFGVNDKITSSGNIFNNTNTTKCMEKEATQASDSVVTTIR